MPRLKKAKMLQTGQTWSNKVKLRGQSDHSRNFRVFAVAGWHPGVFDHVLQVSQAIIFSYNRLHLRPRGEVM
jgi:hypothetical protein